MGQFLNSFDYLYILVRVDYVSKWVDAIVCKANDHKVVEQFLKENIFALVLLMISSVMEGSIFVIGFLSI